MISEEQAQRFGREWVEAWNAHDLDAVLSHYTDDFEMSSPLIVNFTGEASGTLRGKAEVGAYWKAALERIPDLHFELLEVLTGANSIVLYYKAVFGKLATEVMLLDDNGKVYKAMAHYSG
jgi:hypothetical protein